MTDNENADTISEVPEIVLADEIKDYEGRIAETFSAIRHLRANTGQPDHQLIREFLGELGSQTEMRMTLLNELNELRQDGNMTTAMPDRMKEIEEIRQQLNYAIIGTNMGKDDLGVAISLMSNLQDSLIEMRGLLRTINNQLNEEWPDARKELTDAS